MNKNMYYSDTIGHNILSPELFPTQAHTWTTDLEELENCITLQHTRRQYENSSQKQTRELIPINSSLSFEISIACDRKWRQTCPRPVSSTVKMSCTYHI
jgi:hypothetical protein